MSAPWPERSALVVDLEREVAIAEVELTRKAANPRIAELRRCLDPKLRGLEVAVQRQGQGEIGPGLARGFGRPDAELGREAERLMVEQGKRLIERAIDRGLDDDVGGVAALIPIPVITTEPSFSRMAPTCPPVTAKSMRRAVNVALPATPVSGGIVSK